MKPMFPFLENNQGFLSVLALLAALAVALFEFYRAERAGRNYLLKDIRTTKTVSRLMENAAEKAESAISEGQDYAVIGRALLFERKRCVRILSGLESRVRDPELIVMIGDYTSWLEEQSIGVSGNNDSAKQSLLDQISRIKRRTERLHSFLDQVAAGKSAKQ